MNKDSDYEAAELAALIWELHQINSSRSIQTAGSPNRKQCKQILRVCSVLGTNSKTDSTLWHETAAHLSGFALMLFQSAVQNKLSSARIRSAPSPNFSATLFLLSSKPLFSHCLTDATSVADSLWPVAVHLSSVIIKAQWLYSIYMMWFTLLNMISLWSS